ncbi:DUF4976 domain-containing protein [Colletotrichum asianum]
MKPSALSSAELKPPSQHSTSQGPLFEVTVDRPNILFILTDDHAAHAMSCYGSRINETPNLDRIAKGGNCFCTNSICAPSRATILTGTYNHVNGVTTLFTPFNGRQVTFPKLLHAAGYQTAIIGKWHLRQPNRLQLLEHGDYFDPEMIELGERKQYHGLPISSLMSSEWLHNCDCQRPCSLMWPHQWLSQIRPIIRS